MKKLLFILVFVLANSIAFAGDNDIATDSTSVCATDSLEQAMIQRISDAVVEQIDKSAESFNSEQLISIIAIVFVFSMPVLIVLITSIYRHKQRKAQYALAEKALETGHEIPQGLFNERENNLLAKGVRNICVGVGVGILLWLVTEEFFSIGIGSLIAIIGIGELIIYQAQQNEKRKRDGYSR